jgi:hypothetical protein
MVEFKQEKWMACYIEGNNTLRTKANNAFEHNFFELLNNAVFGKTMQNVRNQMNLHLTTDHNNAIKWFSKCSFQNNTYANGLYLIDTHKDTIVYDEPVYVGCAILELSKLKMLELHYDVIDKQFGNKAKLIYSETDSFVCEVEHYDTYKWQKQHEKDWFDLSDSLRPELQSNEHKHQLWFFKNELNSQILTEWISLNPKCYAFRHQSLENNNILESKKANGGTPCNS